MGIVIDKANREPIPFASVVIIQNDTIKVKAITDFDGKFKIERLNEMTLNRSNFKILTESVCYIQDTLLIVLGDDNTISKTIGLIKTDLPCDVDVKVIDFQSPPFISIPASPIDSTDK